MPPQQKRTRAAVEAELAALQAELDTAEPDDEVWVKDPDTGHEVKITGRRAAGVLERFAGLFPSDDGDAGDGDGDQDEPDPQPGGAGGYFRGRKG